MTFRIGDREIGTDQPPYVIAEIGVNHDGSAERAITLVDAARAAGADAVKLQFFRADLLLSADARLADYQRPSAADPFALLEALQLDARQLAAVIAHARAGGLHAILTVFSLQLVTDAAGLDADAHKTSSADITNRPLIEALRATRTPLLVSSGASTIDEVRRAAGWLEGHPHLLLQCVSAYPTPEASAAIGGRAAMRAITRCARGYSDHTMFVDTGALAVAAGASLLEKHLTYDRAARGPDHAASLDPEDFSHYVRLAHRAWRMRGPARKVVLPVEEDVRTASRQSLVAVGDLPAGHVLRCEDLTIKRPGTGLDPFRLDEVIGRRLGRAVRNDRVISEEDLA